MIKFGLLGCGRIAKRHSDLLGGGHISGAELVAVCDEVRERADAIAAKFNVPAFYDIDDFLGRKDIQAVSVLTPSGMHPAHVIAAAKAGKHVIVEKPMALRLDKDVIEKFSVNPPNVYGFGHQAYYEHVIKCLNNQSSALVDGLQGRKILELISALYESIETGKEVSVNFVPQLCRLGELP
ncbi:Gfo/Idh/MocA family oxidoreductase [Bradyrhizobium retamae]|uniref:Uncharacterized protein n=1 Tax=Bradyrhizobium retamae TaxID=1300035 RepID=A0A0R3MUM7_9BRAD|nr:Gfo/Idh/MocA family oxidoreductase [Bradyrhizobium retamae]KRR23769.1 hypothetical protein CQ13_27255 [Bradyrhizobium retamae]